MPAKKTPEELRAKNRERQRKWRANNLTQAQLKSRNAQRIRRGTMEPMEKPVPNGVPNSGISVPNASGGYGELSYGPFPDEMPYEEGRIHTDRRQPHQPGVARKDPDRPPEETENEATTYAKFAELKARKTAGKLNRADGPGIDVKLEL
jgi:hypothetical protein